MGNIPRCNFSISGHQTCPLEARPLPDFQSRTKFGEVIKSFLAMTQPAQRKQYLHPHGSVDRLWGKLRTLQNSNRTSIESSKKTMQSCPQSMSNFWFDLVIVPVVPHEAVAEVSRIGNLQDKNPDGSNWLTTELSNWLTDKLASS